MHVVYDENTSFAFAKCQDLVKGEMTEGSSVEFMYYRTLYGNILNSLIHKVNIN